MNRFFSTMVFVGVLGVMLAGAALMTPQASRAGEAAAAGTSGTSSSDSPVPNATYDETQPGADDPRVREGFAAYQAGDFKKAYDIWLPLAEAGNAEAQFRVGWLYGRGEGVELSGDSAVQWYHRAAEVNHSTAAFNLGVIYRKGDLIAQNINLAKKYYLIAVNLGDVDAQHNLGILFTVSDPPHKDFVQAYKWFFIAIKNGRSKSMDTLNKLNRFATPEERHEGLEGMREWFQNHPRK